MTKQMDLLDWLDSKAVIREEIPAAVILHRAFVIEQLRPIIAELKALALDDFAISEALHYYAGQFQQTGQNKLLNPRS